MEITAKLNRAIEAHIESNVDQYIQFGEFDPSLSALRNTVRLIEDYSDTSYLYEAIDGDSEIARDLYLLAFDREYYQESPVVLKLRKRLIDNASRILCKYEHLAWRLWDDNLGIDQSPGEPDINVQMPELRALGKLIADFETEFSRV
jgi:hypothetical protein